MPSVPRQLAELVAAHPLFQGLPVDMSTLVAGCSRNVVFRAGELVIVEGQPADTVYLVRRGHASLEIRAPGKRPLVIETIGPGSVIGWSWLLPPYQWRFDVRATDDIGAIAVDASCVRAKAEADPAFGYELVKRLTAVVLERLQDARVRLLDLYGSPE